MRKWRWLIVGLVVGVMLFACGKKKDDSTAKSSKGVGIKAGFVYVGPVGDAGWTYAHNQGRLAMEKLPYVTKTTFVENVPEGAEAERVIRQLVETGNNLIFTTSFGFMDPTLKVAKMYPNVVFMHCSGYKQSKNVGTYFGRMYEAKYLAGIVAAKMSKKGVIGFVAPHPIPEVIRHINAFTLGAQSVNPKAKVRVVWTNSWFDPGKEMDAANALIDAGCDIIAQGTDSASPQQAAEKRGVYSLGYDTDMSKFAPKSHMTAPIWHWDVLYKYIAEQVHNKTWKSEDIWWGLEKGLVGLSPYGSMVPKDVRNLVAEKKQAIIDKKLVIFAGPIKDQKGNIKVENGKSLTDKELLSIDWFVQGVIGKIPSKGNK